MPVRIARIELDGVQALLTDEGRRWVEQQLPGRAGSVFQELGRGAVSIRLEGLLLGESALDKLETLRRAQAEAKPVPFAADIASGLDFTDVLIDALHVRQVAGYRSRYWYRLDVREHVEEPPPAMSALAALDAGVEADAASWAEGAVGAAGVMQDVTTLPDVVALNPEVLEHLSTGDLQGALTGAAGALSGSQLERIAAAAGLDPEALGSIVSRVQNIQLSDVFAAYQAIKDPGSIPDLLRQNPGLLDRLGVSDLGRALVSKADALTGGQFSEALQSLGRMDPAKVVALVNDLRQANSLGEFVEKLAAGGIDLLEDLTGIDLGEAGIIIKGLQGAADFIAQARKVGDKVDALISRLRAYDPLAPVRELVGDAAGSAGSAGEVVQAVDELVLEVSTLLASDTAKAVLHLAREAGVQEQAAAVLEVLANGITEFSRLLEGLRQPLQQLDALGALLTLSGSLVDALSRLSSATGEDLTLVGLGGAKDLTGPMSQALALADKALVGGDVVIQSMPRAEKLDALRRSLGELRGNLLDHKQKLLTSESAGDGGGA